jgi:hypothetical protein
MHTKFCMKSAGSYKQGPVTNLLSYGCYSHIVEVCIDRIYGHKLVTDLRHL